MSKLSEQMLRDAANRLHHLSMRYAGAFVELTQGKPVGIVPTGYPGLKEFRDLTDLILLCRAELNGLTKLMVEAKLVTVEKLTETFREEYDWLTEQKAQQFGIGVSDVGLVYGKEGKK